MRYIFLLSLTFFYGIFGNSQCSMELLTKSPDCGDNCEGSFLFNIKGHKPITYTHIYGSATVSSPYPDPIDDFNVGTSLLCAGEYSFHMIDNLGCELDTTITILAYGDFEAELLIISPNSGSSSCDGEVASIAVVGGIEPLSFLYNQVLSCDTSFGVAADNLCVGSYFALVVDSVGCEDYTPCISTQFLSTDETRINNFEITFQADILKVSAPFDQLYIYNLSGQIVLESLGAELSISTDELVAGIYIVSLISKGKVYNQKVIKN